MGWTTLTTRSTAEHAAREVQDRYAAAFTFVDSALVGWHLWAILQPKGCPRTLIAVFLLDRQDDGRWAFKDLSERSGPAAHDCPLPFLARSPLPTPPGFAAEWRNRVLDYHALVGSTAAASL